VCSYQLFLQLGSFYSICFFFCFSLAAHEKAKEAADTNVRCKILGGKTHLLRGKKNIHQENCRRFLCVRSTAFGICIFSLLLYVSVSVVSVAVSTLASAADSNSYYCLVYCHLLLITIHRYIGVHWGEPPPTSHLFMSVFCISIPPELIRFYFHYLSYFFCPHLM